MSGGELAAVLRGKVALGRSATVGGDSIGRFVAVTEAQAEAIAEALESATADRETIRIAADALAHGFVDLASRALRAALESRP